MHVRKIVKDISDRFCSLPLQLDMEYYCNIDPEYEQYCYCALETYKDKFDMKDCVEGFKDVRTARDFMNAEQIDIAKLKAHNRCSDKRLFEKIILFLCCIRFIDYDEISEYFDYVTNLSESEIIAKKNKLLDYLDGPHTKQKLRYITQESNKGKNVHTLFKSDEFALFQKLAEFFDLWRHPDKNPVEYNTFDPETFIMFCLLVVIIKDYVMIQR